VRKATHERLPAEHDLRHAISNDKIELLHYQPVIDIRAGRAVASQFNPGRCRCNMPVEYVEAVRAYYDLLLRMETAYQPKIRIHG
jgi:hypothetical protein